MNTWNILKGCMDDGYFNDGKRRADGWSMDAVNGGWMFLIKIWQDGKVVIQNTTKNTEYSKYHYKRVTSLADPHMADIINEEIADFRSRNTFNKYRSYWFKKFVAAESKSYGHS
jgi:hypothetical protein